jgi:hypothetical protein
MIINFSQLEEIMSPLTQMCKKEKSVNLSGVNVTLRALTPTEESEVQALLPEVQSSSMSAIAFADTFRRETLARAIVEINGSDLRSVKFVEKNEKTPNGVPIKVSKEEAVQEVLSLWSRHVIAKLFEHYTRLSEEIEEEMDDSLRLDLEDIDSKKKNLENRAKELSRPEALEKLSDSKVNDESEDLLQ